MAQDLRHLFKDNHHDKDEVMPNGHEARFLQKLDNALPESKGVSSVGWWKIAASVVILLGMSYGAYQFSTTTQGSEIPTEVAETSSIKTMSDVSPDLKKVEDYYLASINLEISKVELTPENKELFDSYLLKLEELKAEYNNLNIELTENGANPLTIDALINNLKLRLNLLHRLQEQLKMLKADGINSKQSV